MSLDVYLTLNGAQNISRSGIFIREGGVIKEISRQEWDERFHDREPVTAHIPSDDERVFDANITHNLNKMADAAGIYKHLWRPEEIGITHARQLIEPLRAGIAKMESDPEAYRAFNPPNGWGSYDVFIPWIRRYLEACEKYPEATVSVWR